MKLTVKPGLLKYLILAAGGLGLILRTVLYRTGIDGRGLLVEAHWAATTLWCLTFAAVAAAFVFTRSLDGATDHAAAYPASLQGALGAFAAMLGIGMTTVSEFAEFSSRLHLLIWVLGLCTTVSLGCIGVFRLKGGKPHPLLHALLCVYFALRMVSRYQLWSSDPQLQDYCFYLSAYVALMLTAYHHAAFDADMGAHRSLWLFSLASVYLCVLSLYGSMDSLLLLGCGIWAFTNLTRPCRHSSIEKPGVHGHKEG